MNEQRDDTTDGGAPSPGSEPQPRRSYYYDDATGYEIYDPSKDDEEDEEEETDRSESNDGEHDH
jgi:hypothetical protein